MGSIKIVHKMILWYIIYSLFMKVGWLHKKVKDRYIPAE